MNNIPSPDVVFPNEYGTSCFLKNVIAAPSITVGDCTYYDGPADPAAFERNNVLFNWPEFGGQLNSGKFCSIATAYSVVARDVEPYAVVGGNSARIPKKRFSRKLTGLLLRLRWRDFPPEKPADFLPVLRNENLDGVIRDMPDS